MATYRKKPVLVQAWRVGELITSAMSSWDNLPSVIRAAYEEGHLIFTPEAIEIKTLEGWMKGAFDDYIIQGVRNELYPCKPDIFLATYEAQ